MSITYVVSGSLQINVTGKNTISGDQTGNQQILRNPNITFAAAGGTAPTISGFGTGVATVTTTPANLLMVHATNPLTNLAGTLTWCDGFTAAGSKLKLILVENLDSTNSITISAPAANNFPMFDAVSHGLRALAPGDIFMLHIKAGSVALTTGTNDALAFVSGAGSPTCQVSLLLGP